MPRHPSSPRPNGPKAPGFSLPEILVALVLIAVAAALLTPAARQATQKANASRCLSNLRQIAVGLSLYLGENRQMYPPANAQSPLSELVGWRGLWYSPNAPVGGGLIPYLGGEQAVVDRLVVCPNNHYKGTPNTSIRSPQGYPYTANYNLMVGSGAKTLRSRLNLSNPARIFVLADSATGETPGSKWNLGVNSTTSAYNALENRHQGILHILWADGRVSVGTKEGDLTAESFR